MTRLAVLAFAAALSCPALLPGRAAAQTAPNFVTEVQGLAPQLVTFAGSPANFQNLVNGLAQGTPVTLVATTTDGLEHIATFTPAGKLTSVQIAQTLEQAREALITRGVAAPTPEQIGITLLGGTLPTPAGAATVTSILPANSAAATSSASTGTSATLAPTGAASLQVTIRPAPPTVANGVSTGVVPPTGAVPATTSATPQLSNTSDTPIVRNTSDSPFTRNTSDTPVPAAIPGALGQPSPAAQMQQRR